MTPLRLRMMNDMQVRNLSPHTQESYLLQVSQFAGTSQSRRRCSVPRISALTRSI